MKIADKACLARGFVSPSFIDVATGRRIPFKTRKNQLSYMSAEAMAAAFGGDLSYVPSKVGFIYVPSIGSQSSSSSSVDSIPDISRRQSWDLLISELEDLSADVQVVGFSYSPSLGGDPSPDGSSSSSSPSSDSSDGDYNNIKPTGSNAVTFHAVSNSSVNGYRETGVFKTNDVIYQAVLIGSNGGKNYILSRVSLDDGGNYLKKPDGFEIALDWTIVFR